MKACVPSARDTIDKRDLFPIPKEPAPSPPSLMNMTDVHKKTNYNDSVGGGGREAEMMETKSGSLPGREIAGTEFEG